MTMIGPDELGELDARVQSLLQTLIQSKKPTDQDKQAARRLLEWVIYPEWESQSAELDIRPIQWSEGLPPPHRDLLISLSQTAAALVKNGRNRDKGSLVEDCKSLLRARGVAFGDQSVNGTPQRVDRQTDARDKFIYQKIVRGTAPKQVRDLIAQHPSWDMIPEAQMIACAQQYAQRHGLPLPKA